MKTIFTEIALLGHDEDFAPTADSPLFVGTDAPKGSLEKIEVLRWRAANGLPLWHPEDADYCERVASEVGAGSHKESTKLMAGRGSRSED